jgi:hydroxyethylthiazole kinase-like uncharacterized protein yjeF
MDEPSRRLYSSDQVRELDRRAIDGIGIPGYVLMQRAAAACWRELRERWGQGVRIAVVCGSGNNGGDGYEIARLARRAQHEVAVVQVGAAPSTGDAVTARQNWLADGGRIAAGLNEALGAADVIVDALFGIGLSRAPAGAAADAIAAINLAHRRGVAVLAVDVPSGLDATSGRIYGDAVRADLTLTFIGDKLGLRTGHGPDCCGDVVVDHLQLPPALHDGVAPVATSILRADLGRWLPARRRGAHKGDHGHVLIVGGDHGMMGAALLAGRAALRCGAGLVSVATRGAHVAAMTAAQPELMCHAVESVAALGPLLERAGVVAIGPGLGQDAWGATLLARVLQAKLPLLLDADALNLLALEPAQRAEWILTPHPGEAARLLGTSSAAVQDARARTAAALRERYGGVAVLKGAGTLIQGEMLWLCPFGNPGMAVGGMGDVLSGVIAALRAQGLAAEDAARAGVALHALAGDQAAVGGERGLLPGDLLEPLRELANPR